MEFMEWMGQNGIPFCIIFTKADKLKPNVIKRNVDAYLQEMTKGIWEEAPQHFVTSSSKFVGRDELLNFIAEINEGFFNENK